MFVVINRATIAPEHADHFESMFMSRARRVDQMPGFVSFQLLKPTKAGDSYMVMVTWESKEHYHAWLKSDAFHAGHSRTGSLPEGTMAAPQTIELYELLEHTQHA
jgi:heme-degrading monooxygenase HmoA